MELDATKLSTVAFLLTTVALVLVLMLVLVRLDNNNCDSIIGVGGGVVSKGVCLTMEPGAVEDKSNTGETEEIEEMEEMEEDDGGVIG